MSGARGQTKTLLALLERHYIRPSQDFAGGVFVPECGINGGSQRRADALYVGFTSTSGRLLVGHELKVTRSDWRKELDSAGKADLWADNCHAWYVVAPGPEVVPADEVPDGWGLMYPSSRSKTRMQVVVKARVHADRTPSWDVVRSVLARVDTLTVHRIHDAAQAARDRADAELENRVAARLEVEGRRTIDADTQRRLAFVDRLERVLGETVGDYVWDDDQLRPEHAAAVLRLVRAGTAIHTRDQYSARALRESAKRLTEGLDAWDDALEALAEVTGR